LFCDGGIVKDSQQTANALSLRQARVLREMLRLGSFTAAEIASATDEGERYVQNLICDSDGVLKRMNLVVPVRTVKQRRAGAPVKVWAIDPDKQDQVLAFLADYRTAEVGIGNAEASDSQDLVNSDEFVYRFVCQDSNWLHYPTVGKAAFGATISIHKRGESFEFSAPEIQPISEVAEGPNTIFIDSNKIASGLAAICQMRPAAGEDATAMVNVRGGEAHVVFVHKGLMTLFNQAQLQNRTFNPTEKAAALTDGNRHKIVNQLAAAVQLYRTSHANQNLGEILVTGDAPTEMCDVISDVLQVRCTFLDLTESFAFSEEAVNRAKSRKAIMNFVPEIGYAFKRWLSDSQNQSITH